MLVLALAIFADAATSQVDAVRRRLDAQRRGCAAAGEPWTQRIEAMQTHWRDWKPAPELLNPSD